MSTWAAPREHYAMAGQDDRVGNDGRHVPRCSKKGLAFYHLLTADIETRLDAQGSHVALSVVMKHPHLDPDNYFAEFWMIIWHRFASWLENRSPSFVVTLHGAAHIRI